MTTDQNNRVEETTVVIIGGGKSGLTLVTFIQKSTLLQSLIPQSYRYRSDRYRQSERDPERTVPEQDRIKLGCTDNYGSFDYNKRSLGYVYGGVVEEFCVNKKTAVSTGY